MRARVEKVDVLGWNKYFIIWLFDQHNKQPILLKATFYYMMDTKILEDISRMAKRGKRSKRRHGIRDVYREALRTIKPNVQASIPVKLEHLKFTILSSF